MARNRHGTYRMDVRGLGEYARQSRQLKRALYGRAEFGAALAKALAPVGGGDDPHPGALRDSIHVDYHPVRHHRYGWKIAGYRIVAYAEHAYWAEVGRKTKRPYEGAHTMRTVAQALATPQRSKTRRLRKA